MMEKPTIVVVEDDPPTIELYREILERYRVVQCLTADPVACVTKERPVAILLDLMLPDTGGIDRLRALKKDPVTQNVPVIVITALHYADPVVEQLGAYATIHKPFALTTFEQRVAEAVVLGRLHQWEGC